MIRYKEIEANSDALKRAYLQAKPFSHVIIDDFCSPDALRALVSRIPDPKVAQIGKSRDYIFAKNKFEKSDFKDLSPEFTEIFNDLISERWASIVKNITGDDLFLDDSFHGGGIHQGGSGSFLDMHADFNLHPMHNNWFRDVNILIYLNEDWKPEYGGCLKLRHRQTGEHIEVEPLFNRCVIMQTRDFTLHGYDPISFPDGKYRRSIAAYGYTLIDDASEVAKPRSTTWYPERSGFVKRAIGESWPFLVALKSRLFGSATARN